jgi:acyl-CoA-binding protein
LLKIFPIHSMTDLRREFDQAAEDIQRLGIRPDNDTLLKLYALYKQGSEGDMQRAQPGFFDFVGTAKHAAWAQLSGVPEEEAMRRYIALVHQLLA